MSAPVLDYSSPVETHLSCLNCGYDLFASSPTGKCPECGHEIAASIAFSLSLANPAVARDARTMGRSLLFSSIFAGLCPGACLLAMAMENVGGAVLMTIAFFVCAFFAAIGERARVRVVADAKSMGPSPVVPMYADIVAGVGLLLINLGAYVVFLDINTYNSSISMDRPSAPILIASGFFLLNIMAWRSIPTWRAHAAIAMQLRRRSLAKFLTFLAWMKAIYETAWLFCCWTPFVLVLTHNDSAEGAAVPLAVGEFFGLFGYAVIWLLMIIAHAVLLGRISRSIAFATGKARN